MKSCIFWGIVKLIEVAPVAQSVKEPSSQLEGRVFESNSGHLGPRTTRPKTTRPVSPDYSALCCNYVNIILIKNTLKCIDLFISRFPMYIIITTLVSLVKIENTILYKEKLNLLSNMMLSLKNE